MNVHLQDLLATRADSVDPPRLDPFAMVARGERLVRLRRRLAMAGAALAVTCTIAVPTMVLDHGGEGSSPQPANPSGTVAEETTPPAVASGWLPLNDVDDCTEELDPGDYGMTANGLPDMPWAVLTVRGGFANLDGWLLKDPEDGPVRGVGYWTVSGVDRDPCAAVPDLMSVGSSVEDLAAALAAQKLTRTTKPVSITLDGHSGLYLELRVPSDIKLADCTAGGYNVWVSDPGGGRYLQEPGQVDRLWILDVDGNTVVLHATAVPAVSRAWRNRQTTMVESVRFVTRD